LATDRREGVSEAEGSPSPERAFGSALRGIRKKRRLSQQELADKSGYHRTYIGLLERGQKSPSLRTIFNIAATLQVKPSEFLEKVQRLIGFRARKSRKG
jgi:transcriptional regulator with XRE-family HTH domain